MAWTVIDTSTATSTDYAAFANLAWAGGCFADGETYESWATIDTTETANWINISTSTVALGNPFGTFAGLAISEGTFADGSVTDIWTTINTV